MIILGTNSVKATGGYQVDNSLRFNDGSSDDLQKTYSSAETSNKIATVSFWIKRSKLSAEMGILKGDNSGSDFIRFEPNDQLRIRFSGGSADIKTNRLFRDVAAFYHIVVAFDSTQGTSSNRIKVYVNGVQETSLATSSYPSQNTTFKFSTNSATNTVGADGSQYYDGYISEFVWIDGQQLAPDQFGEFDEDSGIWKPIDVSGLTFGNNGFYLEFKQAGTSQNSSGMGADTSGNDNHYAVNNLTAIDQSTDTCTNNFATMNPVDNFYQNQTFSEGNLKILHDNPSPVFSTIGVSSGKWYMEAKAISGNNDYQIGICSTQITTNSDEIGLRANDWGYKASDGKYKNNGSDNSYGSTYATGNIIGVYLDLDNNKLYFAKNGTIQNSGTGISITAPGSTPLGAYFFALGANAANTKYTWEVNFGNPLFTGTDQADANGYGSFEYSPSAGTFDSASKNFYALNTKNLAEYG